jgi:ubiquinone/menaquinone biosynthesis C-methylase UbiE
VSAREALSPADDNEPGGSNMSIDRRVAEHYARRDLGSVILAALQAAGKDVDLLTLEDLAPVDEFHVRGRQATEELTRALKLGPGMRVLDVGSGIGGPSRYVAATYDCEVVGIDLTEEYCQAAALLAERVGLSKQVEYRPGNALAIPLDDGAFDAAYTQHVAMNINDKARLYGEVWRVLKPGGRFGIYDLLQGSGGDVVYPVPWARDASTSFLVPPDELRRLLDAAGFAILSWRDTAAEAQAWLEQMKARMVEPSPQPNALRILFGEDAKPIAENVFRNLLEDRVVPIEVICRKP